MTSGSTNCVAQTLTNLQAVYGTLDFLDYVDLFLATLDPDHSELQSLMVNITCTDCLLKAYEIVDQDRLTKGLIGLDTRRKITTQCMDDLEGKDSMGNRVDLLGAK